MSIPHLMTPKVEIANWTPEDITYEFALVSKTILRDTTAVVEYAEARSILKKFSVKGIIPIDRKKVDFNENELKKGTFAKWINHYDKCIRDFNAFNIGQKAQNHGYDEPPKALTEVASIVEQATGTKLLSPGKDFAAATASSLNTEVAQSQLLKTIEQLSRTISNIDKRLTTMEHAMPKKETVKSNTKKKKVKK